MKSYVSIKYFNKGMMTLAEVSEFLKIYAKGQHGQPVAHNILKSVTHNCGKCSLTYHLIPDNGICQVKQTKNGVKSQEPQNGSHIVLMLRVGCGILDITVVFMLT